MQAASEEEFEALSLLMNTVDLWFLSAVCSAGLVSGVTEQIAQQIFWTST